MVLCRVSTGLGINSARENQLVNHVKVDLFRVAGILLSWLAVTSLALLVAMVYYHVFNRAAEGALASDFIAHINIAASGTSESVHLLFHNTLAAFSTLTGVNVRDAAAIILLFYVVIAGALLYLVMAYYLKGVVATQWIVLLTLSLMVIAGIHVPQLHQFIYFGIGSPNVLHNPTTIAVKPFAFAVALSMICASGDRTARQFFACVVLASVGVMLSAYAKPNFALALIGATPLFLGYLYWKHPMPPGKLYWLALPMVFALIVLAVQFMFKFVTPDSTGGGIAFGWITVAGTRGLHPLLGILLLTAFPLVVLFLIPRILRDRFFVFSLMLFLVAALQYLFLHETGTRMYHGNFGWGRQIVVPLLFATALGYTLRQFATDRSMFPFWKRILLVAIYLLHLVSGFQYFLQLSMESSYH